MKEYAVYRGDELLVIGTVEEVAKHMEWKHETVAWYVTPTGKERLAKRKNPDKALTVDRLD